MRAVGRIFAAMIGFCLAVVAAAAFLLAAHVGLAPSSPDHAAWFWGNFAVYAGLTASVLGAAAFLPWAVLVLVSEIFSIRSFVVHVGAGGLTGLAGALWRARGPAGHGAADGIATAALTQDVTMMAAAGFVGGFVYWVVAGRMAGLRPPGRPSASPPDRTGGDHAASG